MADQGLLLVPRRDVCLSIRPSAETYGKDLGTVKMGISSEKGETGYSPIAVRNILS